MNKAILVVSIIVIVSLALNAVLGIGMLAEKRKNQDLEQSIHLHTSVLNFANLFINKVLRTTGEISFEDRLKIENAVRDTNDKEIYDQWQKFVNVQTEAQGREEIKNLLQLIVNKLS